MSTFPLIFIFIILSDLPKSTIFPNIYIYIYIYIYICVCVCVCACVCVYLGSISSLRHIWLNIINSFCQHTHTHTHTRIYIYIYIACFVRSLRFWNKMLLMKLIWGCEIKIYFRFYSVQVANIWANSLFKKNGFKMVLFIHLCMYLLIHNAWPGSMQGQFLSGV